MKRFLAVTAVIPAVLLAGCSFSIGAPSETATPTASPSSTTITPHESPTPEETQTPETVVAEEGSAEALQACDTFQVFFDDPNADFETPTGADEAELAALKNDKFAGLADSFRDLQDSMDVMDSDAMTKALIDIQSTCSNIRLVYETDSSGSDSNNSDTPDGQVMSRTDGLALLEKSVDEGWAKNGESDNQDVCDAYASMPETTLDNIIDGFTEGLNESGDLGSDPLASIGLTEEDVRDAYRRHLDEACSAGDYGSDGGGTSDSGSDDTPGQNA